MKAQGDPPDCTCPAVLCICTTSTRIFCRGWFSPLWSGWRTAWDRWGSNRNQLYSLGLVPLTASPTAFLEKIKRITVPLPTTAFCFLGRPWAYPWHSLFCIQPASPGRLWPGPLHLLLWHRAWLRACTDCIGKAQDGHPLTLEPDLCSSVQETP